MSIDFPEHIGLCPVHGQEFYMPIDRDTSLTCPACSEEMAIYVRLSKPTKPSAQAVERARERFGTDTR